MKTYSALELEPRHHRPPSWELGARYVAAYGCMLMALFAAWPSVQAPFAPVLLLILVAGLPMSLWLRANGVRYGGRAVNRLALSSIVMGLTVVLSLAFLTTNLAAFGASANGLLQAFLTFSPTRSFELLLGVFLIFGVCRCLFILSDKDALLCSVSSFAVLLLLLVVQKEPIIVLDFMVWTVMTAILLALEHRRESRRSLSGFVSAAVPGQDVKLSGRSLAAIMAVSLSGAVALSYTLAASDSSSRSAFEEFLKFVTTSIGRVSSDATDAQSGVTDDATTNLIDYRSAPPIPTRTVLWRMMAQTSPTQTDARGRVIRVASREVFPTYWRLSTLGNYDGASWTPISGFTRLRIVETQSRSRRANSWPYVSVLSSDADATRDGEPFLTPRISQIAIRQIVIPARITNGNVPALPLPWRVLRRDDTENVGVNVEGAFSIRDLKADNPLLLDSVVSPWPEYSGLAARNVANNPKLRLSAAQKKAYLQLSPTTPKRVLDVARLRGGKGSALQKARRLTQWVQSAASYTLRPPGLPEERDVVDFFLFESRRGFCTHFAGALAVLCRQIGIPARVATGFANPEREEDEDTGDTMSVARAANAHAWTEVWIDGQGWIPLDATPADDRGDNSPTLWGDIADRVSAMLASFWLLIQTNKTTWLIGIAATALLGATTILVGKRVRDKRRWISQARALFTRRRAKSDIEYSNKSSEDALREARDIDARAAIFAAWNRAQKQMSRKYQARPDWQTPHDWIAEAQRKVTQYDLSPLQTLVELHRRAMYDPRFLGENEKQSAQNALKSLSWKKLINEK